MAKFKKIIRSGDGIVYSTHSDEINWDEEQADEAETPAPDKQQLRLQVRKFKGNKSAVVVMNFKGSETDMEALAKQLKTKCACGGSVKEGEIILQGEVLEKVRKTLTELGYKHKGG